MAAPRVISFDGKESRERGTEIFKIECGNRDFEFGKQRMKVRESGGVRATLLEQCQNNIDDDGIS